MKTLVATNISKSFEGVNRKSRQLVVDDFSLYISSGECVGFIGKSGCGKTTFLKIVAGIINPDEGSVMYNDESIKKQSIAFIFQNSYLLSWRTVKKNIALTNKIQKKKYDEKAIRDLLYKVGLENASDKYPHEISGGMQSRCALARSLSVESGILLMDEPFGNLDPATRNDMNNIVKEIITHEKKCSILVTHSVIEAYKLCNVIYVFKNKLGGHENKDYKKITNLYYNEVNDETKRNIEIEKQRQKIIEFISG